MANQRPINRRPWRRKPWTKSRPVRWCELNVNELTDNCAYGPKNAVCTNEDPSTLYLGTTELWNGDFDAEYADDANVVVERIVGDVVMRTRVTPDAEGQWIVPALRMGLLAVEEVEDISTWTPPNLWLREDFEEFEWMWLFHTQFDNWWIALDGVVRAGKEQHLDLRVKRKLGKKDHLVMLAQFAGLGGIQGSVVCDWSHSLRGLFSSK